VTRAGGVLDVPGFFSGGTHAGLKRKGQDIGILYSENSAVAAGVFTTNKTQAAPVVLSRANLDKSPFHRAAVVNSGCANACTGERGWANAVEMAEATADVLGIKPEEVLVASTGIIGKHLDMRKLLTGIEDLGSQIASSRTNPRFSKAILTTDTHEKTVSATVDIGGMEVTFGGAAKGSGMIHPNMATMLGFIATDAAISKVALRAALRDVTSDTFNMITVDGDTSTNDCVLAFANGDAGNHRIDKPSGPYFRQFQSALHAVCRDLALQIVRDGEGATKVFAVKVTGARRESDARAIARAVASSNLVKCAIHGSDPNWGRIVCAAGYAGADFAPEKARISVSNGSDSPKITLFEEGEPARFDEKAAHELLQNEWITLSLEVGRGNAHAEAWGCDFSHDYVTINAHYRT
jgi:glutamate N-acetyltransferase/amino-acid N-acetyltransferase